MRTIDAILRKLDDLITAGRFEELESDTIEIKPVPAEGGQLRERHKSACAFLNTRGGILILGIKEEGQGPARRYVFTGYHSHAEPKLMEMRRQFADAAGRPLDLGEFFLPAEIKEFRDGRVALVYVDELPADRKYCFYNGEAGRRVLTSDERIRKADLEAQAEYVQQSVNGRELRIVDRAGTEDFDLEKVNAYINALNRTIKVDTTKPDLDAAIPFLERKMFLIDGRVSMLGMLVCGRHPGDFLGFRCQLHGYVDVPGQIAGDKHDFVDTILPLMEGGYNYILRNIRIGISAENGRTDVPEYPFELLSER